MIYSMTGYGKAVAELPNKKISIEIRSLNSKQFDLYTRIPVLYRVKEMELRNLLSQQIKRGKIDLNISVEQITKDISSNIDRSVVKQYYTELKNISQEMGVKEPEDWLSILLRLPEVIKQELEELEDEEWNVIEGAIDKAVAELNEFRKQEGEMLEGVLREKINNIRDLLSSVDQYEKERIDRIRTKLLTELSQLDGIEYDRNRFEQEIIYYIEKLDINEEKTRLAHHLDYFEETLNEKESQGKKLGFITQEIGREINTLGSKSNHSKLQHIVVRMKDELEQIKEQILNVL